MTDDSASSQGLGGRLGGKLAQLVVQAHLAGKGQSAGITRGVAGLVLQDFFAGTGAELVGTMGHIFRDLADHPDTPDDLRKLFGFLSRGKGEMASFIGGSVTGTVISGGLGDLVTNALAPVVHAIIESQPFGELAVGDIARAKARAIPIGMNWEREAARAGYNSDRFRALVELNYNRPDVSMILDQLNRGIISQGDAEGGLIQLGFRPGDLAGILATRRTLLTPATLADMVVRGIMGIDQAEGIAFQSGVNGDDFQRLVDDTGEVPGLESLLFARRRGFIDQARLEKGIAQSRVRTEWTDVIVALSQSPMSTADAVEAAVQGHLSHEESQRIAEQNGLMPEHWQVLYDTAGNPPGVQEMVSMYHRGKLTLDQLRQGIMESRLKDKYVDVTIEAAVKIPPERSIVSLVAKSGITPAEGTQLLLMLGYAPEIAAALMAEAHATKTQKSRTLTESMVTSLYEDQAMTADEAKTALLGLGYDDADVAWILALADASRTNKYRNAVITKVGASYIKGLTSQQDAQTTLQSITMPQAQVDQLFVFWDLERQTVSKTLTEAQVLAATKKGYITVDQATARLQGMGYGADDVAILLAPVATPPTTGANGQGG